MDRWRLLCALVLVFGGLASTQRTAPRPRSYRQISSTASLERLASLSSPSSVLDFRDPSSLLAKILIPRAPGSQNLTKCRAVFRKHFESLTTTVRVPHSADAQDPVTHDRLSSIRTWSLEEHAFTASTPYGDKPFVNQIFTHDPTAQLKLVVAAHIDSKYFPTHPADQFVGATDSAAPVAIILEAAKALTPLLDAQLKARLQGRAGDEARVTLQVVLLDGEEAFQQWTDSDSIYGARALAEKWSAPTSSPTPYSRGMTTLDTITSFILLDLLGSASPSIQNYYRTTTWLYDAWLSAEQRLGSAGILWADQSGDAWSAMRDKPGRAFFRPHTVGQTSFYGGISDDHIPFLTRGVPILHLIALPFPKVWHTLADDASALDYPTVRAWALITQLALAEYFGLEEYIPPRKRNELVSPVAPVPWICGPTQNGLVE